MTFWVYVAGIITTVLGAYVVHLLTHNRWWREHRLRKLEELYVALHNHEVTISEYYTRSSAHLALPEDAPEAEKQHELLRTDYLKALQEDEKKAAAIPMIVSIYFPDLLPAWQNIEAARKQLNDTHINGSMLDKSKREALGRQQREAICMGVAHAILGEHLPELACFYREIFTKIVQMANDVKEEKPWPFSSFPS